MKILLRSGLVALGAVLATACLLGLIVVGILKMEASTVLQKMNADKDLYIFPVFILCEFYFLANDLLAYLSKEHQLNLGLDFSEIRFTYYDDVNNTPIPLRSKLLGLYPLSIAVVSLGFALVLFTR